jgi:hypothetical protein
VSFADDEHDRTWVFDVTFLTSNWTCLFGNGCPGVLDAPAAELEQGCCSYGAHFTDAADRERVEAKLAELEPGEWQFQDTPEGAEPIVVNNEGETVSQLYDDACVFLNRPDHPGGAGCALHSAALRRGESIVDWKPEVCWQVPIRRHDEVDAHGHVTTTIREWKRRDWGPGGAEFHWWCTDSPDAFIGTAPVWETCKDELVALSNKRAYAALRKFLRSRAELGTVSVPHPALKAGRGVPTKTAGSS